MHMNLYIYIYMSIVNHITLDELILHYTYIIAERHRHHSNDDE